MVLVHVEVAGHLDGQVEEPVAGEQFEHMVEEAHPRGDLGLAGAVQGNRHGHIGLGGAAADASFAHRTNPWASLRRRRVLNKTRDETLPALLLGDE